MILHLLADDKFTDYAVSQFDEACPELNDFIILVWTKHSPLVYVTQKNKVRVILHDSLEIEDLCCSLSGYKAIITHNLGTKSQQKIVERAPNHIRIAWVFWGFEIYSSSYEELKYFAPRTRYIYVQFEMIRLLKNLKLFIQGKRLDSRHYEVANGTFKRVHFCLTDIHEDYELAREHFGANFEFVWYNYYSIETTIGSIRSAFVTHDNILVGNSATMSNNHIDVFAILSKLPIEDQKIIAPLSYGNKNYAKLVINRGQLEFKNQFVALTEFLPRDTYNSIIITCSIVIMYQKRHQAMGNILTALWLGSKVYLSIESTTYAHLKRLGIIVFSVEYDLVPENPYALRPLDHTSMLKNRDALVREYGHEIVKQRVNRVVNLLTSA